MSFNQTYNKIKYNIDESKLHEIIISEYEDT